MGLATGQEADGPGGITRSDCPRNLQSWITIVPCTKQDLVRRRIILLKKAFEVLLQISICTVQWL